MGKTFRDALVWHMERDGTKISDLVKVTGISRDVINKLLSREKSTTSVENALLIAAYYEADMKTFIARGEVSAQERLNAMLDLLQPAERQLIEAQIQGILQSRAPQ